MTDPDNNYIAILLEQIRGQNEALLEGNVHIYERLDKVPTKDGLTEIRQDLKVVEAVVKDISRQIHGFERRLISLESTI